MRKLIRGGSSYGTLLMLTGLLTAVPLLVLPFYPQETRYAPAFLLPSAASLAFGLLVNSLPRKEEGGLPWRHSLQKNSLTVLFAWAYGAVAGAFPFAVSGQLRAMQALFEAVSGFTTTGLSVMDVAVTPHIFLFHRSFMQFCGGLGFVMMAVMFVQGKQSMSLYSAEGHPDVIMPSLRRTARHIAGMYLGFLCAGTILYRLAGMRLFDGLTHAMCALSTGGFSTRLHSIGDYGSLPVEGITVLLMLVGTTNFAVLKLLTKRRFRRASRVSELRFMLGALAVCIPLTALALAGQPGAGWAESLRAAAFNVSSALSTTGYATVSFQDWPPLAVGLIILLMLVGGGIGSTAGGIKLARVYLLWRVVCDNIRRRFSPARSVSVSFYHRAQGKTPIDADTAADTVGFVFCYLGIFAAGGLLLTLTENCSLTEGMFEFASALGTVGLSIGITGPSTGTPTLVVEMVGMILGRLEIFIVLVGLYSGMSALRRRVRIWRAANARR